MEPVTLVRPNGSGFMHLQRALQPGENIPKPPTLAAQLLACRLTHAEEEMGDNSEHDETIEDHEDTEDEF
ncbi:MAG TPA: hypothetical protein VJM53_01795 [Burkholderiales bacterium]|nr:hypothetical protein [Burkholderiales bacterium]